MDKADWKSLSTLAGRARFISQLAAANLDSAPRFYRVQKELSALLEIVRAGPVPPGSPRARRRELHPAILNAMTSRIDNATIKETDPRWISAAETRQLHAWLKDGFERLARNEKWRFEPRVEYEFGSIGGIVNYQLRPHCKRDLLAAGIFELLRDSRGRFRKCRECGTPFIPIRRQSYCSSRCSGTIRKRTWRNKKRQRAN